MGEKVGNTDILVKEAIEKYNLARKGIVAITLIEPQIGESLSDVVKRLERREFETKEERQKASVSN